MPQSEQWQTPSSSANQEKSAAGTPVGLSAVYGDKSLKKIHSVQREQVI
jgi:hypothetical protein